MKKLLLIFAIAIVAISVQAQQFTGKIKETSTWDSGSLRSFVLTNTDTVEVLVTLNSHTKFTLDAAIKLDSISGNPTGSLYVLGRKADTEAWTSIANVAWNTADGTLVVSDTTSVRYRQILLRFISGGTGITNAESYWLKLWAE